MNNINGSVMRMRTLPSHVGPMMANLRKCFLLVASIAVAVAQQQLYLELNTPQVEYGLPELPYPYGGLEPYLDNATLRVHHLGHHKAYAKKMNAALQGWREKVWACSMHGTSAGTELLPTHAQEPHSDLARSSILDILARISEVPEEWKSALRNNGGGFVNHVFYWSTMCPNPGQSERLPDVSVPLALLVVCNTLY